MTVNALSPIAATRMLASVGRAGDESTDWDPLDPANASPVVAWLCSEQCQRTGEIWSASVGGTHCGNGCFDRWLAPGRRGERAGNVFTGAVGASDESA